MAKKTSIAKKTTQGQPREVPFPLHKHGDAEGIDTAVFIIGVLRVGDEGDELRAKALEALTRYVSFLDAHPPVRSPSEHESMISYRAEERRAFRVPLQAALDALTPSRRDRRGPWVRTTEEHIVSRLSDSLDPTTIGEALARTDARWDAKTPPARLRELCRIRNRIAARREALARE